MKWHIERIGESVMARAANGILIYFTDTEGAIAFGRELIAAAEGPDSLDKIDEELGECT